MGAGLGTILGGAGNFIGPILMETGWDPGQFTFWITMYAIGMAISMSYVGRLWVKINCTVLLATSFLISMAAMAGMGFYTEMWQWNISGFVIGLSGGVYFMVAAPIIITNWFAKTPGLALGVLGVVAAILSAILSPVQSAIIGAVGWRTGYFVVTALSCVLALPWIFFVIRFKPEDKSMRPIGWEEGMADITTGASDAPGVSVKHGVLSICFICLFFAAGLCALYGGFQNLWNQAAVEWGFEAPGSTSFSSLMISATALFGLVGPVIGIIIDKFGAFKTTYGVLAIQLVASFGLYFFHGTAPVVLILVFFFAFQGAVVGTLTPLLVREAVGPKNYSKILGYAQIGIGLIGGLSAPIIGTILSNTGSFNNTFIFGAAIAAVCLILVLVAGVAKKALVWEK
jgi:MFS family permease